MRPPIRSLGLVVSLGIEDSLLSELIGFDFLLTRPLLQGTREHL